MLKDIHSNYYSPLVVFTYNRPKHLKSLFESLFKCDLVEKTSCIVYCDFPKNESDYVGNNEVKSYLETVLKHNSFKSFEIIYQNKNKGLAASIIEGVSFVLKKYDRVIVLEDDLIVSKKFIAYMNDCLSFFQNNDDIWSISGYGHSLKSLKKYNRTLYLSGRSCSWGWGTWKNRWETVDWEVKDYRSFRFNILQRHRFAAWGRDMPSMLDSQVFGASKSWAIRWCYSQFKNKKYTVYPVNSFVKNMGCDGSGTNFTDSTDFYSPNGFGVDEYSFEHLTVDKRIKKEFKKYNISTFKSRFYWLLRRTGLLKQ